MKAQSRIAFVVAVGCLVLSTSFVMVEADSSLLSWSCSHDVQSTQTYRENLGRVIDAMENDILNYASWDFLSRTSGAGYDEVTGFAGCFPSAETRTMQDCHACIVEARAHLLRLCSSSLDGGVSLKSCSLTFARAENVDDVEELNFDDEHSVELTSQSSLYMIPVTAS